MCSMHSSYKRTLRNVMRKMHILLFSKFHVAIWNELEVVTRNNRVEILFSCSCALYWKERKMTSPAIQASDKAPKASREPSEVNIFPLQKFNTQSFSNNQI